MGEERPERDPGRDQGRDPGREHPGGELQDIGDSMSRAFRLVQAPPTPSTPHQAPPRAAHRIYTDRDTVEEDLLKLVLTLVELLRQLIERQALRR
ncbi:gas vesicle protein GvpK, partial [Streptomyces sp. NPDC044571]|uniref:gas vesicle protein GvpK n=1 Tax=Streptomyces sp. NPDC044571 TaxID=3155371 RepID=UPI003400CD7F